MAEKPSRFNKDAKFWISKDDWNKVIAYADSSYHQFKSEIGGQMVVVEDDDGDFILKAPIILQQTVSAGDCEMEAEALALHYSKMVKKYGDNIRHCWRHSHHTMKAFWSGTDNATILANEAQDFTVSLVVNLKQEYKLRIQFFYPFKHEENVTLNFLEDADEARDAKLDAIVKQMCTKATVVTTVYNNTNTAYGQSSLWTKEDQNAVDEYNHSYGVYSPNSNTKLDLDQVPPEKMKSVTDLVEDVQDKLIDNECTYEQFLEMRKTINKSIKQYNLKMKLMNQKEIESSAYHYGPEHFLENIKGRNAIVY